MVRCRQQSPASNVTRATTSISYYYSLPLSIYTTIHDVAQNSMSSRDILWLYKEHITSGRFFTISTTTRHVHQRNNLRSNSQISAELVRGHTLLFPHTNIGDHQHDHNDQRFLARRRAARRLLSFTKLTTPISQSHQGSSAFRRPLSRRRIR